MKKWIKDNWPGFLIFGFLLLLAFSVYTTVSKAGPPHVINDQNADLIKAQGIAAGHGTGYIKGQTKLKLKFGDAYPTIPRSQWKDLVRQGKGTFLSDLIKAARIPSKDQDGLNYCWSYASVSTVEVCRLIQGQPYVSLSPESVGGPVTGWRNVGGYGIDALNQLSKKGCCASSFMSAPNSLNPNRWKAGWEADCANHKVTVSWAEVEDFDQVYTALLLRMPVSIGLDWWSHQVLLTDPVVFDDGSYGVVMRNSWGENWPEQGSGGWSTLTERKSQPSGSFAAINVGIANVPNRAQPISLIKQREALMRKLIDKHMNEGACKP